MSKNSMIMVKNIAVFASGSGSNAENIIRFFDDSGLFSFPLIVTNRKNAYVLQRAAQLGIDTAVFSSDDFAIGTPVLELLRAYEIDAVVLAGFLLKVPDVLIDAFPERIINIHPALLPKFGGEGMYGMRVHQAVVDAGESQTGITIHFVNEQYDEGNIIFQAICPVFPEDTAESVAEKVHLLEYEHFPLVIKKLWGSFD